MEEAELKKILDMRREWFGKAFVIMEIIKALKFKELAFLSAKGTDDKRAFRYMWANHSTYWEMHTAWANFFNHPMNCYCSVANLKSNVPIMSYNLKKRKEEPEYQEFNKNYINYVDGYDLFFDIDFGSEWEEGYKDAKVLKSVLEDYQVPYFIQSSSFKGMHIIIPSCYMPEFNMDLMVKINHVINQCKIDYAPRLDVLVGDIKRLRKISYALNCDGSVVFPLSDWQFDNFRKGIISFYYVLKNITLKSRGLLIRDYGLSSEQLKENVIKFINEHVPKNIRFVQNTKINKDAPL